MAAKTNGAAAPASNAIGNQLGEEFDKLDSEKGKPIRELQEMAKRLLKAREEKEKANSAKLRADKDFDELETAMIERIGVAGLEAITVEHDGAKRSISILKKSHFSMPPFGDQAGRKLAVAWLTLNGMGEIVRTDVNSQTLNSMLREWEEQREKTSGEKVPDDYFKRYDTKKLSIVKK